LVFNTVESAIRDQTGQIDGMRCHIVHSQSDVAIHDHGIFMLVPRAVHHHVAAGRAQNVQVMIPYIFDHRNHSNLTWHRAVL
jgi:hypothetical protein